MPKCCVMTCKNGYDSQKENTPLNLRWFSLPKSEALRGRWLFQIHREDEASFTRFARICSAHFRPEDFLTEDQNIDNQGRKRKRRNLVPGAIPTINMRPPLEQGLSFFFLFQSKMVVLDIHFVAIVQAVQPFYTVKCLCSRGWD